MTVYIDIVILLNFAVDLLLLLGTNCLCGYPPGWKKLLLAATLGGVYGGACLLPGMSFLGNSFWRLVSLILISVIAFGCSISGARRGLIFTLLCLALGGAAVIIGNGGVWSLVVSAAVIALLCALTLKGRVGSAKYLSVVITYQGRSMHITALHDTGNTLRDPVSGGSVLIVGSEVAQRLFGFTPEQLQAPVKALVEAKLPGLRLIPYHSVGVASGLLLALRVENVKIGNRSGSSVIAFAPDVINAQGEYQALTGGSI